MIGSIVPGREKAGAKVRGWLSWELGGLPSESLGVKEADPRQRRTPTGGSSGKQFAGVFASSHPGQREHS